LRHKHHPNTFFCYILIAVSLFDTSHLYYCAKQKLKAMVRILLATTFASAFLLLNCTGETRNNKESELDSRKLIDDRVLIGQWFKPHEASVVNICFDKNRTFKMHDYEERGEDVVFVERKGTYCVECETIKLMCVDSEEQTLECIEMDGKIYLRRDSVMMTKGLLN